MFGFREFKLAKSDWENKIVEHFVTNNAETKMHESLRLIDIENLERYYNSFRDDSKLKEVILLELVRSACTEQARVSRCQCIFISLSLRTRETRRIGASSRFSLRS